MPSPKGYTRTQIILHWVVFLLVALQFVLHEGIAEAWDVLEDGGAFVPSPVVFSHVVFGLSILALVVWRIAIKARRGAPALPDNEPALLKAAAHGAHLALYGLMVLMAVTGGMAWFGGQAWAADVHEVLRILLLLTILLHFVGALYQQFVLKSGVMRRMGRPE